MSRTVLRGARYPGDIAFSNGKITAVGAIEPVIDDIVIHLDGDILTPGLINTHHHLYQWMTRGLATGCNLFEWLKTLYPVWGRMSSEDVHAAALVGLGELALSGCTTAFDHHYVVPNGDDSVFDVIVDAAQTVGIRLFLSRGSMDLGESKGGLPPDHLVEDRETILTSTERIITEFHDGEMVHVVVAPCSPFSVTSGLMLDSATLARKHGLRLHTHLCETLDEQEHCIERFGKRPVEQLLDWGWTGDDVWFAHGIHFSTEEIHLLGREGIGVAHCPSSNARLAAGMCPVVDLRNAQVPVGLGVDGVASNEVGGLFPELRQALYTARIREGRPNALMPEDVLELGTIGGAKCLGLDQFGSFEIGAPADFAVWDANDLAGVEDPIAGLILGPDRQVRELFVAGERRILNGELVGFDLREAHRNLAIRSQRLWN
ncbi:MAG: 8-oxoguanine deaminase [Acidimicrobiales bacterium]|nr:8-oxoguanine deaminase [Acidimicrobiales bacterium]MDP6297866.1 8-oxoguanine deaminase [Acidimicrobiales bacterium]HJM28825.1 8-oxoguanine deaminase [Acidimicrobiales bacterium]HJM97801.1 8-oxoguanine deaminase [Acidimicrobiales bacterium]